MLGSIEHHCCFALRKTKDLVSPGPYDEDDGIQLNGTTDLKKPVGKISRRYSKVGIVRRCRRQRFDAVALHHGGLYPKYWSLIPRSPLF